jgi:hypothetical protein
MEKLTRAEVANILKVTVTWLATKTMRERLPFYKDINNRVYYKFEDVQKYINEYKNFTKA